MASPKVMRVGMIGVHSMWFAATTLALTLSGCGPAQQVDENRSTISGSIAFDGKPLPAGTITFASEDGPLASMCLIREGGRYWSDRVPIGKNQVTIETEGLLFGSPHLYVRIPRRYADPTKSGFTVDVKPGENENVNFELKK